MIIGTSLEVARGLSTEAATKKVVDMQTYSVIRDESISNELHKLAESIKDTDGNSKDAKENLEARRVAFFDRYFNAYSEKGIECFEKWNVQKRHVKEIVEYIGYKAKQIPQMVKFFAPLFKEVREVNPKSLGMPITTQSEKLWKRSESLAIEHDTEVTNVFKSGVMNLSLFSKGSKLKDEDWAEIQASWDITYWEMPDWKKLRALKGRSVSREVVDVYMVMSEADREAEKEKVALSVKLKAKQAKDQMKKEILASLDIDDLIQIASDIDIDLVEENQLRDLKKEFSTILEQVVKRLANIAEAKKEAERREAMFAKFVSLSEEQLEALANMEGGSNE